ncbi:hypothetical protein MRB53_041411 [Persea americana]|nr:hypothetical protein MRB53_041411 [Persea americana]
MKQCIEIKKAYPELIAGFDLVGHEDPGRPLADMIPILFWFRKQCAQAGVNIPFFFHAGETLGTGSEADLNLFDAILLGTRRLGHAFSLYKHPLLMNMVRDRRLLVGMLSCTSRDRKSRAGRTRWRLRRTVSDGLHSKTRIQRSGHRMSRTERNGKGLRAQRLREHSKEWEKLCNGSSWSTERTTIMGVDEDDEEGDDGADLEVRLEEVAGVVGPRQGQGKRRVLDAAHSFALKSWSTYSRSTLNAVCISRASNYELRSIVSSTYDLRHLASVLNHRDKDQDSRTPC